MVPKSNARRLKCFSACASHIPTPSSFHNNRRSSISGFRYTSISLPGCFGPGISTGIIMNFRFIHNQGGRLYIQCHRPDTMATALPPKGFMPSVEPYIPRIICKCWEYSVHFSPLRPISGVSQHIVLLTFFFVPSHQFSIGFVHE